MASSTTPNSSSSLFEYDCEAVRVHAKRFNAKTGNEEYRKFSVDPNLTSYDILKSILMRAFDISEEKSAEDDGTEFVIYFSSPDADWMPLLSDWDGEVCGAYGVRYDQWKGHTGLAQRSLFIIDGDGIVRYRWHTLDALVLPDLTQVVEAVEALAP